MEMLFKVEVYEEGRVKTYTIEANNRKEAKLKIKKEQKKKVIGVQVFEKAI
jgi:hypothetical protein